jgi:hypothetical protein
MNNNNLPEGLFLSWGMSGISIRDAQDVTWVVLQPGGFGDPPDWQKNIIQSICETLKVDVAISDEGDESSVEHFLNAGLNA